MNPRIISCFAAAAFAMGIAGCTSEPTASLPRIHYPVTYNVPVGNTTVASAYGPQNLNVSATQDVTVQPNVTLYYQVNAPISVTMYVYEKGSAGQRGNLIGSMQGTSFVSSINPSDDVLEFAFAPSVTNTNGTLQFTLSDTPLQPALPSSVVTSIPVTQQTTTTRTTTTTNIPTQN
jgi:hypothetical protein